MYENGIICKRCAWKDCDLRYDSRNVLVNVKIVNTELVLCLMLISINVPYHDQ